MNNCSHLSSFRLLPLLVFLLSILTACTTGHEVSVKSPDGENVFILKEKDGSLTYKVKHNGKWIIAESDLGLSFKDGSEIGKDARISGVETLVQNERWEAFWGESKWYQNHFRQSVITILDSDSSRYDLAVRAYNDGIAFRYQVHALPGQDSVVIADEKTAFNLAEDSESWWIKAYHPNRYEQLYQRTKVSAIDTVQTPLTIRRGDGIHLSIHEAALKDYSSMQLAGRGSFSLECDLAPWSNGDKVRTSVPFQTPWRTLKITDSAAELAASHLVLNCNEPNAVGDVSWARPRKYVGVWWGMIIGKWTWKEGPRHGATTARAKRYIDFAAENSFDEVLVEGISAGFESLFDDDVHTSFLQTTDDFDLEEVQAYAQSKGVSLQAYLETSASTSNFLSQIDSAFSQMRDLGITTAKIGHVGSLLDNTEFHYGQFAVEYYRTVLEKAVEYGIAVNFHEPIKDTGERRTFPNMLTREGARGMEYNAWGGGGNPINHETTLAYTRLLESPMDFTPGNFDLLYENLDATDDPFEVQFKLIDRGNGYSNVRFKSSESYWQSKAMQQEVVVDGGDTTYIWTITEALKPGIWEWGISAQDVATDDPDLWLVSLLDHRKQRLKGNSLSLETNNLSLEVQESGKISGDVTLELADFGVRASSKREVKKPGPDPNVLGLTQRVNSTLAKQLALYVCIYSPLQMASDFIENYDANPAFQFIEDVPVNWDTTIVLGGEVGEFITVARKDRDSEDWYLGSITDSESRMISVDLSFLNPQCQYEVEFYADGKQVDWESNPLLMEIGARPVESEYRFWLAPGGGHAARFKALDCRD